MRAARRSGSRVRANHATSSSAAASSVLPRPHGGATAGAEGTATAPRRGGRRGATTPSWARRRSRSAVPAAGLGDSLGRRLGLSVGVGVAVTSLSGSRSAWRSGWPSRWRCASAAGGTLRDGRRGGRSASRVGCERRASVRSALVRVGLGTDAVADPSGVRVGLAVGTGEPSPPRLAARAVGLRVGSRGASRAATRAQAPSGTGRGVAQPWWLLPLPDRMGRQVVQSPLCRRREGRLTRA